MAMDGGREGLQIRPFSGGGNIHIFDKKPLIRIICQSKSLFLEFFYTNK